MTIWSERNAPDQPAAVRRAGRTMPAPAVPLMIALAVLGFSSARAATNQWSAIGPPIQVRALAVDPQNDDVLYAAGQQAVARSFDRGETWTTVDVSGLLQPTAVRVAASIPSTIYALGYGDLFRSTNGGITWVQRTVPRSAQIQTDLQVSATSAGTLVVSAVNFCFFGCTGGGVYRSDDGGDSWRSIGFKDRNMSFVAIDPSTPQIVYAGTEAALFRTANGGGLWKDVTPPASGRIQTVVVDPRAPTTLYAATDAGLLRSEDSGQSWEKARPNPGASLLATAGGSARRLFALNDNLVLSVDGGRTWQDLRAVAPGAEFHSLEQIVAGHDACYIVADLPGAAGQVLEYEPAGPRRRAARK